MPREAGGTTVTEMPLAMWIMILGMCFPFLILSTSTIRFGLFWNACREAAQQASRCQTFAADSSIGLSAVHTASLVATNAAGSFSGISIVGPVNTYILRTDAITGATTRNPSNQKLANAADVANNIYDIQVELNGQIEPLIRCSETGILGSIPGLTGPFPVVVRAQYSCEMPQGLNK